MKTCMLAVSVCVCEYTFILFEVDGASRFYCSTVFSIGKGNGYPRARRVIARKREAPGYIEPEGIPVGGHSEIRT